MSKKRKTRSQKERATERHTHPHVHAESEAIAPISYSVKDIEIPTAKKSLEQKPRKDFAQFNYLKKDIRTITVASGVVLAFDILLFTLLSTGVLNLGFLGY